MCGNKQPHHAWHRTFFRDNNLLYSNFRYLHGRCEACIHGTSYFRRNDQTSAACDTFHGNFCENFLLGKGNWFSADVDLKGRFLWKGKFAFTFDLQIERHVILRISCIRRLFAGSFGNWQFQDNYYPRIGYSRTIPSHGLTVPGQLAMNWQF